MASTLLGIWSANLKARGNPREKLQWYHDSPAGRTTVFLLECETPGAPATCVGSGGLRLRRFVHEERRLDAALFADLAVEKAHRTVRPVLTLQRAIRDHTRQHFDFAYGFPNPSAVGVYRRVGYHDLGPFPIYVRVLRHASYVPRAVGIAGAARIAGAVLDGLLALPRRLRRSGPPASTRLEWLSDVDERFEALALESSRRLPLLGERSASFLRWRFLRRPGPPCEVAALVEGRTTALRAYAIVQRGEDGAGHAQLLDILGATDGDLDNLLSLLTRDLRRWGAAAVSLRFFGTHRVQRLLAAHGFRKRAAARPTAVVVDVGDGDRVESDRLRDPESWYLTAADRDN